VTAGDIKVLRTVIGTGSEWQQLGRELLGCLLAVRRSWRRRRRRRRRREENKRRKRNKRRRKVEKK
jgi:hypothetical protein